MAASDARPVPRKGVAYRITFALRNADFDLVSGATGRDSEISKDGGTYVDCTNESVEIATSSGTYYLDLTATEMNADTVSIIVKSSNAKPATIVLFPEEVGDYRIDNAILVDEVWDEVLNASTHNVGSSAAKRLRNIASNIILDGMVVSSTINTVTFNGDASTVDGAYDPGIIYVYDGTGAGQSRMILEYKGSTKTAVVDRDWRVRPDATSSCVIVSSEGREHVNEGLAQAGGTSTITLNANASALNDAYNGQVVFIRSGLGEDQARRVTDYNGTTKVAIVERAWGIVPDATSAYVMLPTSLLPDDMVANDILNSVVEGSLTFAEWMRLVASVLFGHSSGSPLGPVVFRDLADAKARITATVDDDGNRSEIVIDGS